MGPMSVRAADAHPSSSLDRRGRALLVDDRRDEGAGVDLDRVEAGRGTARVVEQQRELRAAEDDGSTPRSVRRRSMTDTKPSRVESVTMPCSSWCTILSWMKAIFSASGMATSMPASWNGFAKKSLVMVGSVPSSATAVTCWVRASSRVASTALMSGIGEASRRRSKTMCGVSAVRVAISAPAAASRSIEPLR